MAPSEPNLTTTLRSQPARKGEGVKVGEFHRRDVIISVPARTQRLLRGINYPERYQEALDGHLVQMVTTLRPAKSIGLGGAL